MCFSKAIHFHLPRVYVGNTKQKKYTYLCVCCVSNISLYTTHTHAFIFSSLNETLKPAMYAVFVIEERKREYPSVTFTSIYNCPKYVHASVVILYTLSNDWFYFPHHSTLLNQKTKKHIIRSGLSGCVCICVRCGSHEIKSKLPIS